MVPVDREGARKTNILSILIDLSFLFSLKRCLRALSDSLEPPIMEMCLSVWQWAAKVWEEIMGGAATIN